MILFRFVLFFLLVSIVSPCFGAKASRNPLLLSEEEGSLQVRNQVLAVVEETPITVVDIKKRLDYLFAKEYPQYAHSPAAKYEFFKYAWKSALQEQIQKHLIKADAKEMKMEITPGDARQAMEEQFGPDIIHTLARIGISYDDAFLVIVEDLLIEKVIAMRVQAKALRALTPAMERKQYEIFASHPENRVPAHWQYRVISIRDPIVERGESWAEKLHALLNSQERTLEESVELLQADPQLSEETKISLSPFYDHPETEISSLYRESLSSLDPQTYSSVVLQESRKEGTPVHRIFFLESYDPGGIPPYSQVAQKMHQLALQELINKELALYLEKLNETFVTQVLFESEEDLQPFVYLS